MNNIQYIAHHGIKGQKWGVRRYQKKDGTYTEKGKKRLSNKRSDTDTSKSKKKVGTKTKQAVINTAKKGKLFFDRKFSKKALNDISTASKIASGSLLVASLVTTVALGPTAIPISTVASAIGGVGTVTGTASAMIAVDDKKK